MAVNFVFLCAEVCWERFGSAHMLKLGRVSQIILLNIVVIIIIIINSNLKDGFPELFFLGLILTEPFENNLAKVRKVDEALSDDNDGHDS